MTTNLFQPAVREKIKLRAAIDGPTGSGKTWTALQLARILAGVDGDIGLLDTESESAKRYAPSPAELAAGIQRVNHFDPPYIFGHRPAEPPYGPVELAQFIDAASEGIGPDGVLIVDSLTHYWTGEGGTLDIVDKAKLRGANAFTAWAEGTPAQRYLLDRMIRCKCHLIITMRSKMEYALEESTDGRGNRRASVKRMGMAPEQRPGIEYEFDVMASMDAENRLVVTKSRIPDLMNRVYDVGRSHEFGTFLRGWLAEGASRLTAEQVTALKAAMDSITDEGKRRAVKTEFAQTFGLPEHVLDVQAETAAAWVAEQVAKATTPPDDYGADRVPPPETDTAPSLPLQGALADALAGADGDPGPSEP